MDQRDSLGTRKESTTTAKGRGGGRRTKEGESRG